MVSSAILLDILYLQLQVSCGILCYFTRHFVFTATSIMWRSRRSSSSSTFKRHQIQEKLNISRRRSSVFGDVTDEREVTLPLPTSPSRSYQDSTWRFTVFSIVLGLVIFIVICFSFYQRIKYILWINKKMWFYGTYLGYIFFIPCVWTTHNQCLNTFYYENWHSNNSLLLLLLKKLHVSCAQLIHLIKQ